MNAKCFHSDNDDDEGGGVVSMEIKQPGTQKIIETKIIF